MTECRYYLTPDGDGGFFARAEGYIEDVEADNVEFSAGPNGVTIESEHCNYIMLGAYELSELYDIAVRVETVNEYLYERSGRAEP